MTALDEIAVGGSILDDSSERQAPAVSVVMSVFNQGQPLLAAVKSILQQTWQDWELLLIDDGSTDGAIDAIAEVFDSRVRVIRDGVNRGLAVRLNQGIAMARGRYIARMDSDDISYPERLQRQLEYLEANPQIDLLGTRAIAISDDNQLWGGLPFAETHQQICVAPWRGFYLPHPTWMGKTTWFRQHQYAIPAPYLCEDQELLLRAHEEGLYHALPDTLFAYRVRRKNAWRKSVRTRLAMFRVQRDYFTERREFGALMGSLVCLLARLVVDSGNYLLSSMGMDCFPRQASVRVSQEEADKLRVVLQSI
jgi:glycosyltransferase involved in cell wall biosynthesis